MQPTQTHKLWELALRDKEMFPCIGYGSAGTGKTFGAAGAAVEWLDKSKKNRVIISRPNVSFADDIGFLPGEEHEKLAPWVLPVKQNLLAQGLSKGQLEMYEKNGRITYQTFAYIQGLTFDNSFIIIDECQNLTFNQIKAVFTRVGLYSKLVLCGDVAQVSPLFKGSGLSEWITMTKALNLPFHTIEFTPDDIMRSGVCRDTILGCEKWEEIRHDFSF